MESYGPVVLRFAVGTMFVAHGMQNCSACSAAAACRERPPISSRSAWPPASRSRWWRRSPNRWRPAAPRRHLHPLRVGGADRGACWARSGSFTCRTAIFLNWAITPGRGHGVEYSLVIVAALFCLALTGPGDLSFDQSRAARLRCTRRIVPVFATNLGPGSPPCRPISRIEPRSLPAANASAPLSRSSSRGAAWISPCRSIAREPKRRTSRPRVRGLGRRAFIYQVDLSRSDDTFAFVGRAVADLGRLDVLVNMASIYKSVPFEETDDSVWNAVLAVDLTAAFSLLAGGGSAHARRGRRAHHQLQRLGRAQRPAPLQGLPAVLRRQIRHHRPDRGARTRARRIPDPRQRRRAWTDHGSARNDRRGVQGGRGGDTARPLGRRGRSGPGR